MSQHSYSIQLFSLRDTMGSDFEGTLRKVSEMGYKGVEFAGFYGHTAEEVKSILSRYDLALTGTHSPFSDLLDRYEETVAFHRAIGNRYYILPGVDLSSQEKIDFFVEKANVLCDRLAEVGITLCYHNHAGEFHPNADGSLPYEQLLSRTKIWLEVDAYWAFVGMKDPLALLKRLGDRVKFIHIKDGFSDGKGMPLGQGEAPVKAVYQKALETGIPLVVESETCNPDGLSEAKICIDYLFSMENG